MGARTARSLLPRASARGSGPGRRIPAMEWGEQQPIGRTVGRRGPPPPGEPPTRAAMEFSKLANLLPRRTPKGVFRYRSHDEMKADRERWTVDAMVAIARSRG